LNDESYEPVEVALSNTQIAAVGALLVLVVVGAFAAGVWWGARSSGGDAASGVDQAAAEQTLALPDAAAAAADEEPPEIVRFFGDADEESAPAGGHQNGETGVVVQVFSSTDLDQAGSVERRLRADGHRAFLSPQALNGVTMQRVRVGPFDTEIAAAAAAEDLAKRYGLETWITPNN